MKQKLVLLLHVTGAPLCEAVGGPTAAKNHSRTVPLPSTLLPLQTRSPTQLSIQPLFSAQRSSHSEKRALNQLSEEEGGKRERENALETQLIKKIEKEWQNPNRLRSCDWKKCFSWAGEKGRSFPGCSSCCETSCAQRLRTGKDELFFILWLGLNFLKGTVLKSSKMSNTRKKKKENNQVTKLLKHCSNITLATCKECLYLFMVALSYFLCMRVSGILYFYRFCLKRGILLQRSLNGNNSYLIPLMLCKSIEWPWYCLNSIHFKCRFTIAQTVRSGCVPTATTWMQTTWLELRTSLFLSVRSKVVIQGAYKDRTHCWRKNTVYIQMG